jgi:hypothetical protein
VVSRYIDFFVSEVPLYSSRARFVFLVSEVPLYSSRARFVFLVSGVPLYSSRARFVFLVSEVPLYFWIFCERGTPVLEQGQVCISCERGTPVLARKRDPKSYCMPAPRVF